MKNLIIKFSVKLIIIHVCKMKIIFKCHSEAKAVLDIDSTDNHATSRAEYL